MRTIYGQNLEFATDRINQHRVGRYDNQILPLEETGRRSAIGNAC